jgi:hypothetical protein
MRHLHTVNEEPGHVVVLTCPHKVYWRYVYGTTVVPGNVGKSYRPSFQVDYPRFCETLHAPQGQIKSVAPQCGYDRAGQMPQRLSCRLLVLF